MSHRTIEEDRIAVSEGESGESWTDSERELASQAVGLVKVTQTCVKRLYKAVVSHGSCSSAQNCSQLDATAKAVRRVSPALDDFVSELYYPVNVPIVMENASKLVVVLKDMLATAKGAHFEDGINADIINKLLQFISHNHCKLDPSVVPDITSLSLKT